MLPNASDLTFFLEISQTGNMSRAAERLGVTQPSLSQAMKRLEKSFGKQLLIRSKTGVTLTRAGQKLSLRVKSILCEWEELKNEASRDESEPRGRYVLGIHSSVALYTLGHIMPHLLEKFPGLEFQLQHELSRKITEDVISFRADFGIVVNPVAHPDLVITELFKDKVVFCRSKKKNKLNSPDSGQAVLIYEPDLAQSADLLGKVRKKGELYSRTVTSSSLEVIKDLVASGAGIGILPKRVIGTGPEHIVDLIKDGFPAFTDRICMVYRADTQKGTAARQLALEIRNYLSLLK